MNQSEFQLEPKELRDLRQLLFGDAAADGPERRENERFPFHGVQLALPLAAGRPISERSICKVQCHDLSRGGIAFYWLGRPDFSHICLGLGTKEKLTWVKARVLHSRPVQGQEDRYLVGCCFVERVDARFLAKSIAVKAAQQIGDAAGTPGR